MVKVVVVDDSTVVRELLVHMLDSEPDVRVIGVAGDGEQALELAARMKPDVMTMDLHMPQMDGLEATRRIMESNPTPIVIVTGSSTPDEVALALAAMEAGALAVLERPLGLGHANHASSAARFVQTIKLMAEVKVVRRWPHARRERLMTTRTASTQPLVLGTREITLVAIGASTGGPPALQTILSGLPAEFPASIVIVQHIAAGFARGFAEWLGQSSRLPVSVANHGQPLLPGHVFVAPDGLQTRVEVGGRIGLGRDSPENGLCPSVSCLFRSVASIYGRKAVGVLLTGMGKDGAAELRTMKEAGAVTIAQDQQSSVVYGMPGEAVRVGAADFVLPPERIAQALAALVGKPQRTKGIPNETEL